MTSQPDQTSVPTASPWWRSAVIYQVYPKSFADGNGDGMGDLPGITSRLEYLQHLGVDAVWLSPFYVSPQADGGYDVADYRDVDPMFGTLADADALIARAHELGLRVIIDIVPNHTSDEHPWFVEALAAEPGSAARERYMFRTGQGENGQLPPNNWISNFGGPAWTQVYDENGEPTGQWYLHLFDTKQPDLNWENPEVRAEFEDVLRFWLDRGVDGFRVDVAHGLIKDPALPDHEHRMGMITDAEADHLFVAEEDRAQYTSQHPFTDQEGVHEIYRGWRELVEGYPHEPILVAEAWISPLFRLFRYVRPDEMHQAFNFTYLTAGYGAAELTEAITVSLAEAERVGAPVTWVLSNHDTVRHASRFGLADPTSYPESITPRDEQPDEALGRRRAAVAALIELALPGSAYVYQGDELGLPDHTLLEDEFRQDPKFFRTQGEEAGRDGARIPMPWTAEEVTADTQPWLPYPESYATYAADQQVGVPDSFFELYRRLLQVRAEYSFGASTAFAWREGVHNPDGNVLAFQISSPTHPDTQLVVIANLGENPVEIDPEMLAPEGLKTSVISAENALSGHALSGNSAVWLVRASEA